MTTYLEQQVSFVQVLSAPCSALMQGPNPLIFEQKMSKNFPNDESDGIYNTWNDDKQPACCEIPISILLFRGKNARTLEVKNSTETFIKYLN